MYQAMDYFETLNLHFKTSKRIMDLYKDQRSWLMPITGAMTGGVFAGPVGAVVGAVGGLMLSGPRKLEINKEYEITMVMLDLLDYDDRHLLVGMVQGTIGSCEKSKLLECLNNRHGASKVIAAIKMFKNYIEFND